MKINASVILHGCHASENIAGKFASHDKAVYYTATDYCAIADAFYECQKYCFRPHRMHSIDATYCCTCL